VSVGEGGDHRKAASGAGKTLILAQEEAMVERRGAQIKGTLRNTLSL
jgi:hypothetical protein